MVDNGWVAIGERLREARIVRGLGQQQLGDALNLDRTMVAKLETGRRRLTALELLQVAETLRVPMGWLAAGPSPAMVSQRRTGEAPSNAAAFDVDVALHDVWEQLNLLVQGGHLRPSQLTSSMSMDTPQAAVEAAATVRAHLGLTPDLPLGVMADVSADLGLHVVVVDSDVDGASMTPEPGLGVAVLGGTAPSGRRRFTCAHEIGHHVLGDEYNPAGSVGDSRDEREARIDAFAAALLLPPTVCNARTRSEIMQLSSRYRVSWSLAVRACGNPDVGLAPTRADFVAAGLEVPEDLLIGHRSTVWRQAVLAAREARDVTDEAALELLGKPELTLDELSPLPEPGW